MENIEEIENEIIVLKNRIAELEKENNELRNEYNELLDRLLDSNNKGGGYNW